MWTIFLWCSGALTDNIGGKLSRRDLYFAGARVSNPDDEIAALERLDRESVLGEIVTLRQHCISSRDSCRLEVQPKYFRGCGVKGPVLDAAVVIYDLLHDRG